VTHHFPVGFNISLILYPCFFISESVSFFSREKKNELKTVEEFKIKKMKPTGKKRNDKIGKKQERL